MNQKTLKKSFAVLLVGIMLLSQSAYADSLAAEVPIVEETMIENAETPYVEADIIKDMSLTDADEAVTENAPIVDADTIHGMGAEDLTPCDDAVAEERYMREKEAKEWQKKQSEIAAPELVGAEESDAPWNGGDVTDLSLDETYEVYVEDGSSVWFRFVPEETGNYKFYSFGYESGDPYANLYDAEGNYLRDDDDGATGKDFNFAIRGPLDGGETYYFEATSYSDAETLYSVSIEQIPTVVDFTPTLVEGAHLVKDSLRCGDWADYDDEPYFAYYDTSIQELFTIEYELSDGTTGEWVYSSNEPTYIVGDSEVTIEFDSESAVVGTNTAVMIIDGVEKTIEFEIIELPDLESFTIEQNPNAKSMLIGWEANGFWDTDDEDVEYFFFYTNFLMSQFVIHATYADGHTIDWEYDSEEENDDLDEKYPITIESYYNEEDAVLLDIRVGEFEDSIELATATFEEVSSGAITDTIDFSIDGEDGYTVYTFTAPQDGRYDLSVVSKYGVSLYVFDESSHRVDTEETFYQRDGYTETLKCTGGQDYYFLMENYDESDHVSGTLSVQKHVSVIDFAAVNDGFTPTIGSEVQGDYDEGDPSTFLFYDTYIARAFTIHLAYDDGTTDVWRYDDAKSMSVRNNYIYFSQITDPPYGKEKGVVRIKIGNITRTTEFKVNRTNPKVKSLAVTQTNPLYAGFDANWTTGDGGSEYLKPYPKPLFSCLEIIATYEDDTVVIQKYNKDKGCLEITKTGVDSPEEYENELSFRMLEPGSWGIDFDDTFWVNYECVDQPSWKIGESNTLKITVGGKTATTKITIRDMLSGIEADRLPSTKVMKNRTPFTAEQENDYEYAFVIKAPGTGKYSFRVETEAADQEAYLGLFTTDGRLLIDSIDDDGVLISEPIGVSLEKDKTYILRCDYLAYDDNAHEATLCVTLPANVAWPTPTPTPTPKPTPGTKLFDDVKDSSHPYYKAIYWAANKGITKGYEGTNIFGINDSCTRGQAVMFLWRLAGKPAPKAVSKSPFKDVAKNHTFYKAILWASQKGITKGYPDGTFGINGTCTRGQIATFIWRYKGSPAPKTTKSPFKDKITKAYLKAVLWAAENGITYGYSDKTFRDTENCTRGQIVTFLYRVNNLK